MICVQLLRDTIRLPARLPSYKVQSERYASDGTFPRDQCKRRYERELVENSALTSVARLREREDQVFLILALVIGALTGLAVVAFILLTERMGMRLYPVGGAPW